jgi:hypothetical protein
MTKWNLAYVELITHQKNKLGRYEGTDQAAYRIYGDGKEAQVFDRQYLDSFMASILNDGWEPFSITDNDPGDALWRRVRWYFKKQTE